MSIQLYRKMIHFFKQLAIMLENTNEKKSVIFGKSKMVI